MLYCCKGRAATEEQLSAVRKEIKDSGTVINQQITNIDNRVNTVESKINTVQSQVSTLTERADKTDARIQTVEQSVSEHSKQISDVTSRVDTVGKTVKDTAGDVKTVKESVAAVDKKVDTVASDIKTVKESVKSVDSKVTKVGAGAALAALHPVSGDGTKFGVVAGVGIYNGQKAVAIGGSYSPNDMTTISIGGAVGNGENMVNAGVSLKVGGGNAMSKAQMNSQIKSLQVENSVLKAKDATQDTQLQELRAEIAALKASMTK